MSKYQTPYRYDFVGSFLRPQEVKQAKADYSEGKITKEECDAIVDKAVTEVVTKQKELGFHIITDGEFRRTYWHLDFMWGFEGVGHEQTGAGVQFKETVIKRIYEAAKYIPLERLCLSPQCGFASCEIGNKLTEEEQWAKLKLVKEIAEEVWKDA